MKIFGQKHNNSDDYGNKLKRVAIKGAKLYGLGAALLGAGALMGVGGAPGGANVKMVRSRGGLENLIR